MVGLHVSVTDEPASSRLIAVSAAVASGQGSLQSALPTSFAQLENPENLHVSFVEGPMLPSQTVSEFTA